jgi:hypothetical protein
MVALTNLTSLLLGPISRVGICTTNQRDSGQQQKLPRPQPRLPLAHH